MSDKIFCGTAKEIPTKYGPFMALRFSAKDLETLTAHLDNGWVSAKAMRKKDQTGKNTHYIEIDTWKPEQNEEAPF